uniref:Uncharacterized protein LOC105632355 isoform X3 n=1 Tax=Rhizophora mucronata TaxID=61149 RepID=A0A2P2MML6_RHIMU
MVLLLGVAVRCLIMQSFLGIEWAKYGDFTSSVPECFVLGPFIEGLNDPVHHKDFGVKGIYTSWAMQGAVKFLHHYATNLNGRKGIDFLVSLASVAKHQSFGRVGLMSLAECIASAACGVGLYEGNEPERTKDGLPNGVQMESFPEHFPHNGKTCLLDALRFVVESSKQHFNPNYRLRVCEKVLEAATSVVYASDVPLENLLHFVDALPREFTDCGGSLRERTQVWVWGYGKECSSSSFYNVKSSILKTLQDFPESFTSSHFVTFDDEDLNAWESAANRWARVLFLAIKEDHQLIPIFTFFQSFGVNICRETTERSTVKFLILTMSLLVEINLLQRKAAESVIRMRLKSETGFLEGVDGLCYAEASVFDQKFSEPFLLILDNLVSLANISSAVFWSGVGKETTLPISVRGKLGGPSQRRLSSLTTTAVLQAITSMRAVSSVSSWCAQFKSDVRLTRGWAFMWEFFWKTVTSPTCDSETGAEILLAAYEALAQVLRALVSLFSPLALDLLRQNQKLLASAVEAKPCLDLLVLSFLQNINNLLAVGVLARTRRAVLLNWKWLCLESLLSIPYNALQNGLQLEAGSPFFSDSVIRDIFYDLVESLENAGEGTVLVMLRSVRLVLRLFDSGKSGTLVSSCNGVDAQVHSCLLGFDLHVFLAYDAKYQNGYVATNAGRLMFCSGKNLKGNGNYLRLSIQCKCGDRIACTLCKRVLDVIFDQYLTNGFSTCNDNNSRTKC